MLLRLLRRRQAHDYAPPPRLSNHLPNRHASVAHEKAGIIDDTGIIICDWPYIKEGIREGWLVFDGWHIDGDGDTVWRYVNVNNPDNAI